MNKQVIYNVFPEFSGRNVPIKELAQALNKNEQTIRLWLQTGNCPFGYAIQLHENGEYTYYCPDKQVWEFTGYFKKGDV